MDYMAISFPAIDPVAVALGPVQVRWYGLAYLAGLTLGWLYMRRLLSSPSLWSGQQPPMRPSQADDFLLWATFGTVIGGRLGYVLLYEPTTFFADPARILSVWEGGMSFHGGFLGVSLAVFLFSRYNKLVLLSLGDLAAVSVPFGLFFGRIANFINGELYGRISDVPWAVDFPVHLLDPGDPGGPRHPSQLYEAFLEGVVLFLVIRYFTHYRDALKQPGLCVGIFLCGYAVARIIGEMFRDWDYSRFFTTPYFSTGMVYCVPMLVAGILLINYVNRKRVAEAV
ncbi:MAG: prolipoprotein diacylglyceryl transferase [Hyphomicrobiales bacterium]|nr:prolipoprotein diacylglyceryl transferase [Hyphomicrobiales bacterium]